MMMKRLGTALVAMAIVAAVPGVAVAQETTERPATDREVVRHDPTEWIDGVKTRALEAIEKRLSTISELEAAINIRDRDGGPRHSVAWRAPLSSWRPGGTGR